jgi:hypothetical protein
MMGRTTLREVREALAAAKKRGAAAPAKSPTVEELESLIRLLEREAKAKLNAKAEIGATAEGGRRRPRRSARTRSPRRR